MNQFRFFKSRSYLLMFFTDSCFQLTNAAIFSLENGNSKKNLKIVSSDINYYSMIKFPDFTNTTENAKGIQNMSPLKGCHTYNKGVACHCSHYTEMGCLLRSTNCQSVEEGTSDRKKKMVRCNLLKYMFPLKRNTDSFLCSQLLTPPQK